MLKKLKMKVPPSLVEPETLPEPVAKMVIARNPVIIDAGLTEEVPTAIVATSTPADQDEKANSIFPEKKKSGAPISKKTISMAPVATKSVSKTVAATPAVKAQTVSKTSNPPLAIPTVVVAKQPVPAKQPLAAKQPVAATSVPVRKQPTASMGAIPISQAPRLSMQAVKPIPVAQTKPRISMIQKPANSIPVQTPEELKEAQLAREQRQLIEKEMQMESIIQVQADQELIKSNSLYDLDKGLSFEVKTLHKYLKLSGEEIVLPIMVSVKTLDSTDVTRTDSEAASDLERVKPIEHEQPLSRPTLDLVCVIDNSGSMMGEKISNLKSTLLQLVDMLNETDRLSLILFDDKAIRLCNLRLVDNKNKDEIKRIIKNIEVDGGTNIFQGLKLAFEVLHYRQAKNQVTSIFLLSDGQDASADIQINNKFNYTLIGNQCFTIHSFGFGSDHDGPIMNRICDLFDGNFYYIQNISQVDEFFIDALGGLFSVVAQEIEIQVVLNEELNLFQKFFKNAKITKTFGNMWKTVKEGSSYNISMKQLLSGVSKDFMFEVTLPKSEPIERLDDFERNVELIKAQLVAIPVDIKYTTKIAKENSLMLTLFTNNEVIAEDSEVNDNVEFNYLRVQAATAMEKAIAFSEKRQFDQGQQVLDLFLEKMESAHPKNKDKLTILKKNIEECKESAKPKVYESVGKYKMLSKKAANFKQQSQAIEEEDIYQNVMQKKMVSMQKKQK